MKIYHQNVLRDPFSHSLPFKIIPGVNITSNKRVVYIHHWCRNSVHFLLGVENLIVFQRSHIVCSIIYISISKPHHCVIISINVPTLLVIVLFSSASPCCFAHCLSSFYCPHCIHAAIIIEFLLGSLRPLFCLKYPYPPFFFQSV